MRIVLVGSSAARARLRRELGEAVSIVGEAPTFAAARASGFDAEAYLVAAVESAGALQPDLEADVVQEALTPREIEVLELLAEGLPNKAIAARLDISDQTVKFHVSSICGKLGAANRTEAVRRAVRGGLITL